MNAYLTVKIKVPLPPTTDNKVAAAEWAYEKLKQVVDAAGMKVYDFDDSKVE